MDEDLLKFKAQPQSNIDEILYLKIAIKEAEKQGNLKLANHYRILLRFAEQQDGKRSLLDELTDSIDENKMK